MAEEKCSSLRVTFRRQGGPGGRDEWDDGVHSTVRQILVYHGYCIDSIQTEYEDQNGKSFWSGKHGGSGGTISEVVLKYPDEYLISIHGYYGNMYDPFGNPANIIRSLTFETNERTCGPYGVEEGTKFSFPTSGAKIVGLHGKSGWYLDSIGLHLLPISSIPN